MPARRPVIAIGIDAADGRLVRRLAGEGRLPAIASLAARGRWGGITSPSPIGSGAVWPTFITGEPPDRHGLFGEYAWAADRMALERPSFASLVPFWASLAAAHRTVAVIDVPFAPVRRQRGLIEIADWGAHDWLGGQRQVHPPEVERDLADVLRTPHPLVAGPVDSHGPDDVGGLRHVIRSCIAGARQRGDLTLRVLDSTRPDLLLAVFTEAHRASHLLWHTLDGTHPAWAEGLDRLPDDVMCGLVDVFAAIDTQIGRLVAHAGESAEIVVFALHGMQPARGIPVFLSDALERAGFAVRRSWRERSAREHGAAIARALKRRVPAIVKHAYYRRVPRTVTMQLAQPSLPVPAWDWRRTRAVSLPTDQHGWIRVNLAGRESQGIVPESEYAATCVELRDWLRGLRSSEGPLVDEVLLTADPTGRPPPKLPDVIVHWSPATWRARVQLLDPRLHSTAVGLKFVGQHDDGGFFTGCGPAIGAWPDAVDATELGGALAAALRL